ncbi:MAG: hypothetical protein IKJ16_02960, partial [Agathobacter sp.]|nr:hypothetical protein [Agathobacter sp.]
MKKNLKKLMALLAVFVMMVSLITVPNASAHAAEGSGSYDTTNTWWGGGSYMTCYAAADSTVRIQEETSQATNYWPEGGFPWFSAIVLDANEDGNYVVTEIVPDDGTNDKG